MKSRVGRVAAGVLEAYSALTMHEGGGENEMSEGSTDATWWERPKGVRRTDPLRDADANPSLAH